MGKWVTLKMVCRNSDNSIGNVEDHTGFVLFVKLAFGRGVSPLRDLDSTRTDKYTTAVLYKTKKDVVIGAGGFYGTKAANEPKIRAAS